MSRELLLRLLDWRNELDFALRNRIAWSRPGFTETTDADTAQAAWLSTPETWRKKIEACYPKALDWPTQMAASRVQENWHRLAILEQLASLAPFETAPVEILEVGVKNWQTLPALDAFCARNAGENYTLRGVELDPWRVYQDGYSRWDYAQAFSQGISHAHYKVGTILDENTTAEWILHCLPFVVPEPHQAWGLPKRLFQPEAVLHHLTHRLLKPGGSLWILNQGKAEAAVQDQLLRRCCSGFRVHQLVCESPFLPLRYDWVGWVITR
jgi:hypothetical protein